jgi:hypothetical protein
MEPQGVFLFIVLSVVVNERTSSGNPRVEVEVNTRYARRLSSIHALKTDARVRSEGCQHVPRQTDRDLDYPGIVGVDCISMILSVDLRAPCAFRPIIPLIRSPHHDQSHPV